MNSHSWKLRLGIHIHLIILNLKIVVRHGSARCCGRQISQNSRLLLQLLPPAFLPAVLPIIIRGSFFSATRLLSSATCLLSSATRLFSSACRSAASAHHSAASTLRSAASARYFSRVNCFSSSATSSSVLALHAEVVGC